MNNICGDNRFEVIKKAKEALLEQTNITDSSEEVAVLDNFLFRCWQMGWLDKYDETKNTFKETVTPLIKYLRKNYNPYCSIIVNWDNAQISEAVEAFEYKRNNLRPTPITFKFLEKNGFKKSEGCLRWIKEEGNNILCCENFDEYIPGEWLFNYDLFQKSRGVVHIKYEDDLNRLLELCK